MEKRYTAAQTKYCSMEFDFCTYFHVLWIRILSRLDVVDSLTVQNEDGEIPLNIAMYESHTKMTKLACKVNNNPNNAM